MAPLQEGGGRGGDIFREVGQGMAGCLLSGQQLRATMQLQGPEEAGADLVDAWACAGLIDQGGGARLQEACGGLGRQLVHEVGEGNAVVLGEGHGPA